MYIPFCNNVMIAAWFSCDLNGGRFLVISVDDVFLIKLVLYLPLFTGYEHIDVI